MLGYNFDVLHKTMHNAGMATSENFGKAKFAFWGFSEVRFPFVTNVSKYAI